MKVLYIYVQCKSSQSIILYFLLFLKSPYKKQLKRPQICSKKQPIFRTNPQKTVSIKSLSIMFSDLKLGTIWEHFQKLFSKNNY